MYREVFWKSIKNLKFQVFLPDLYLLFIEVVLALLFIKFSGIAALLNNPEFIAASIEQKLPMLGMFLSQNMLELLLYLTIFVLTSFILGASLNSMRYGMIRDIVLGERLSFSKVLSYGVRFWRIVVVRVIVFVMGVLTFLFLLGSYVILKSRYSLALTLFITTSLALTAIFFLKLLFLFTFAIMFFEQRGAFASVKNSFVYFFKNKGYVFKVFLIVLVLSIVLLPFEIAFNHYQAAFGFLSFYTILFLIIRSVTSTLYGVWSEVLIFYSYRAKSLSP